MSQSANESLELLLKKLEKTAAEIRRAQGYTKEVESLLILSELIKEQNPNENSHPAVSTVR